ncbi:hypothetical protein GCM10028807_17720 [Spirosoma daeguense]
MNVQTLTSDQIAAMPIEQAETAYRRAKSELDSLLARVEKDNRQKPALQEAIQAARLTYVLLRARIYPKVFGKLLMGTSDAITNKKKGTVVGSTGEQHLAQS